MDEVKKINLDSKEINLRAEKIKLESSELVDIKSYQKAQFTSFQTMNIDSTKSLKVNSTNMSMNAMEGFKTTAQKVDLGAEKQMKISSQAMEVHGTDKMDLKSPALNKVTQAEKISLASDDKKDNQFIAVVTPTSGYKGEFGIDYCEMDEKFEKIEKFQGTKISDIEYIFNKTTNQYIKVATGDSPEKQNIIKEMYFTKTIFGKSYLATWMNIPVSVVAKVNLKTVLIKEGEGKDKKEEYITFKENPNFEIKYDGQINSAIQLKGIEKSKEYKNIEIKALKTFETVEYIEILDEGENIVGIIEMSPNKVEELEIKIIPVVKKNLTPDLDDKQAEAIYNKAISAKNAKNLNLNDTLNQQSLNQAGIKSKLITNPKGAEKLVIDVTKDQWINYYDKKENGLKNWQYDKNEADKNKRPSSYKNQDGNNVNRIGLDESDSFIDKLINEYYIQNDPTKRFKGALVFVTEFIYMECDEKTGNFKAEPLTLGISRTIPIKNNGVVMFKDGLDKAYAYAHELAHMLGLEHSFFKNEEEFKNINERISKNLNSINKNKEEVDKAKVAEEKNNKFILENEEYKKELERRNEFEKKEVEKWEQNVKENTRDDANIILEKHKNKQAETQKEIDDTNKKIDEAKKYNEIVKSVDEKGTN